MRTLMTSGCALVLVCLAARAADDPKQAESPPKVVKLSDDDSGGVVHVPEKAEVVIRLRDQGKPGHAWQLAKHDPKCLEPLGKEPKLETGPDLKAAGEKQVQYAVFRFKALQPGELELHYAIPHAKDAEPVKPAKEFKLKVEVVRPK